MPRSRQNILLNFKLKNEASRANLNKNKRILKWRPFWNKVYWVVMHNSVDGDSKQVGVYEN